MQNENNVQMLSDEKFIKELNYYKDRIELCNTDNHNCVYVNRLNKFFKSDEVSEKIINNNIEKITEVIKTFGNDYYKLFAISNFIQLDKVSTEIINNNIEKIAEVIKTFGDDCNKLSAINKFIESDKVSEKTLKNNLNKIVGIINSVKVNESNSSMFLEVFKTLESKLSKANKIFSQQNLNSLDQANDEFIKPKTKEQ